MLLSEVVKNCQEANTLQIVSYDTYSRVGKNLSRQAE